MRGAFLALISAVLSGASAAADYYQFTGSLSIPVSSRRFLPMGSASVSGSGVGFSGVSPSNAIHLSVVNGFTGTLQTAFGSTGGFTQQAFFTAIGDADFSKPAKGKLHGKMAVGGLGRRRINGSPYAGFPFTKGAITGLGLGGTLPAFSGQTPVVKFGTWTTGTVAVPAVIIEENPALGTYTLGTISAKGADARTTMGMGTVQFVTPIRTTSGVPANRAAIAKLTLTFAPEPGRAVPLLVGCLALALLGTRRARAVNA
jgi:hypothetical protein